MECAEFEKIVHDLERPETEGFALRDRALAHAESCSHCARLMTDAESLDAALGLLARNAAGRQASPRVRASLLEEFRLQKIASSRRRVWPQIAALGVAAALLLALGFSLHSRMTSSPSSAPSTNVATRPLASPDRAPNADGPDLKQPEQASDNRSTDDSEFATAFVPLPYADDHTATDGGTVVRVVLSQQALASLGVPVTDLGTSDRIPADLLLSQDGAPQAIRLVSRASIDE